MTKFTRHTASGNTKYDIIAIFDLYIFKFISNKVYGNYSTVIILKYSVGQ